MIKRNPFLLASRNRFYHCCTSFRGNGSQKQLPSVLAPVVGYYYYYKPSCNNTNYYHGYVTPISFRMLTTTATIPTSSTVIPSGPSGGISPEVQTQVLDTCADIHSSIMALNERLRGPLPKNSVSVF